MSKIIATCGHEVTLDSLVNAEWMDMDGEGNPCTVIGTLCPKCYHEFKRNGLITEGSKVNERVKEDLIPEGKKCSCTDCSCNKHSGQDFDEFLEEEGIENEVTEQVGIKLIREGCENMKWGIAHPLLDLDDPVIGMVIGTPSYIAAILTALGVPEHMVMYPPTLSAEELDAEMEEFYSQLNKQEPEGPVH